MKKILELITEEIKKAFEECQYDKKLGKVVVSNRPDLCQYQCNGAMAGAKLYHKAPIMIANDVVEKIKESKMFSLVEAVNPGFINMNLNNEFVAQYLNEMKNAQKLNEIGRSVGAEYGMEYLLSDFKKKNGYKRSIELSAIYGLYRQDYCGCEFSYKARKSQTEK